MNKDNYIPFKAKYHEEDGFKVTKIGVYITQQRESGDYQTAYLTHKAFEEIWKQVEQLKEKWEV